MEKKIWVVAASFAAAEAGEWEGVFLQERMAKAFAEALPPGLSSRYFAFEVEISAKRSAFALVV